jgi:hypothetical protein
MGARIDGDQYARLRKIADKSGRSVTDEIRERLAASFERDRERTHDPRLVELQEHVAALAQSVELDLGVDRDVRAAADERLTLTRWHNDPVCFAAFAAGVRLLVESYRPAGEAVPRSGVISSGDDPETIGRTLARLVLRRQEANT